VVRGVGWAGSICNASIVKNGDELEADFKLVIRTGAAECLPTRRMNQFHAFECGVRNSREQLFADFARFRNTEKSTM
jgi:hypothetical protein